MWGVCLDNQAMDVGLFQAVIRYEIDHLNNTVVVTLPKTDLRLCVEKKSNYRHLPNLCTAAMSKTPKE